MAKKKLTKKQKRQLARLVLACLAFILVVSIPVGLIVFFTNDYSSSTFKTVDRVENIKKEHNLLFVSGGCSGADKLGERYATEHGYKIEVYPAEWKKYGPPAGPIRNMKMAKISDFVICFWDGESNGTRSMINCAKKLNKPIKIKLITKNT
jgi:hypothetical protein